MTLENVAMDNKLYRASSIYIGMFIHYTSKGLPKEAFENITRITFDEIIRATYYNPSKEDNQVRMTRKFNGNCIISEIKKYLGKFESDCLCSDMITVINGVIRSNRQLMIKNHRSDENIIDDNIIDVIYNTVDEYRELLEKLDPKSKQFSDIIYEMDNVVISEIDFKFNNIHEIQKVIVNRLKELKIV